jgi:hypothetical protein
MLAGGAGPPPPSLQTRETEAPLFQRGDASPPLPRWRRSCSDATTWQRRDTLSLAANARRQGVHLDSTAPTCGCCANLLPRHKRETFLLFRREDVATRAAKPSPVTKSVRQSSPSICYHRLYSLFPLPGVNTVKFWEVVSDLDGIERDGLYKGNNDEPALVSTACEATGASVFAYTHLPPSRSTTARTTLRHPLSLAAPAAAHSTGHLSDATPSPSSAAHIPAPSPQT